MLQADGRILIGGNFTTVSGIARANMARLSNDIATQTLSVPSTSRVEWLRGRASPEAYVVTFDLSVNGGTTWTRLGAGTRINGGWELTGLPLLRSDSTRNRASTAPIQ